MVQPVLFHRTPTTTAFVLQMVFKYWLLKAEPDSRVVKGKDVKFSVDDFETVRTSPWEGVRNYEAGNLMKSMRVGDKALFYHSNCKNPGIAAFAEVVKEAYPDYTAWDPTHPYFDPKSDKEKPRWFMIDLQFKSRADHFVPLSLLKFIDNNPANDLVEELEYLGEDGVKAIKGMDLIRRGRLSVQRVEEDAWNAIVKLAEKGGWDDLEFKGSKSKSRVTAQPTTKASRRTNSKAEVSQEAIVEKPHTAKKNRPVADIARHRSPSDGEKDTSITDLSFAGADTGAVEAELDGSTHEDPYDSPTQPKPKVTRKRTVPKAKTPQPNTSHTRKASAHAKSGVATSRTGDGSRNVKNKRKAAPALDGLEQQGQEPGKDEDNRAAGGAPGPRRSKRVKPSS